MMRALLVDDVPLAREKLRHLLAAHADISIVGEAGDIVQARDLVARTPVDLLLLDIHLPGDNGLQLAEQLAKRAPLIIFVTAHAEHAVASYAVDAVDYLLKPLAADRLAVALERARRRLRAHGDAPQPLCIRNGGNVDYIALQDIDYIDNAGHYACVHVGRQVHLLRESIGRLAAQLAAAGFVQIQRAVIVNRNRIRALEPRHNGDATVILVDGTRLPLSRLYRMGFDAAMRAHPPL